MRFRVLLMLIICVMATGCASIDIMPSKLTRTISSAFSSVTKAINSEYDDAEEVDMVSYDSVHRYDAIKDDSSVIPTFSEPISVSKFNPGYVHNFNGINFALSDDSTRQYSLPGDPKIASMILSGDILYYIDEHAMLNIYDLSINKVVWKGRLVPSRGYKSWHFKSKRKFKSWMTSDADTLYVLVGSNHLFAFDTYRLSVKWDIYLSSPIDAPVVFRDGMLFTMSLEEILFAIDAGSGEVMWTSMGDNTGFSLDPEFVFLGGNTIAVKYSSGAIVALNTRTGDERWSISTSGMDVSENESEDSSTEGGNRPFYPSKLTSSDGMLIVSDVKGYTNCIRDGDVLWRNPLNITSNIVAYDNYAWAASDNIIICFDVNTGMVKWYNSHKQSISMLFIANSNLFVLFADGNSEIISPAFGDVLYTKRLFNRGSELLTISDNHIYTYSKGRLTRNF